MKRDAAKSQPIEFDERERYDLITNAFEGCEGSLLVHGDEFHRIYGRVDLSLWAILDSDDFAYFSRWRWSYARGPAGKTYIARRSGHAMINYGNGIVGRRPQAQRTIYLHREIHLRRDIDPPSRKHKFVHHRNGNSLDCRRLNLSWATVSMNNEKLSDEERRSVLMELAASRP